MKRKLKILSAALALLLCVSSMPAVYAEQEFPSEEPVTPQVVSEDATIPTPAQVYEAMIALKDQDAYKEGTTWTNDEPYSDSKGYYRWKGGPLGGANIVAVGCVAFAFILSDEAFGSLPARMYDAGEFDYENIKVGDILRVNNDVHTVIVLEVNDVGVVVAEGNISTGDHKGKVHWGRTISKEDVMSSTSHYITRYPEGYIPPDDPTANEIIGSGTLGTGLSWKLTKAGTLTISGSGAMPDFNSIDEQPWNDCSSQIRTAIIEEGVTNIGACAFWKCGVLNVEIPSSVTAIGNYAFRESSLISVNIPGSVKTIGNDAFNKCVNLSSVTVSEGLESIGERAFQSCTKLASIDLPASIGEVGAGAFWQCQGMISAIFAPGSKQVQMGDNIFTQCYGLAKVILPQSIDRIGNGMFQNCHMLAGVEIPQGAGSIGESAFASSAVSVVVIPDSVKSIETAAFASCPLKDIYFTGSESQWNSVHKSSATAEALEKVTMHYNYIPGSTPTPTPEVTATPLPTPTPIATPTADPAPDATPEPGVTIAPDMTPEPGTTPDSGTTPEPGATPAPVTTPEPGATAAPDTTPEPGTTAGPETTPEPGVTPDPGMTPNPGATTAPNTTPEPGVTTTPETTTEPGATTGPDATAEPSATLEPGATTAPAATPEPEATAEPAPILPDPTPAPVITPVPTAAPVPTPNPVQTPVPTPVPTPDPKIPFIKGESGKEGWEAVKNDAANAFDGKWVNVNMNGTSAVPGNVIDSIKGQNVTIAFDMGNGLTWFVNGKNVTAERANDVDFSVQAGTSAIPQNLVESVAGSRQSTQLALAYDGYFGYSAVLMIYLGQANAGLYANLYYYNESDGILEFVTADQINEDGIAELVFSHASDYLIVVGEDVGGGNSNGNSSGNGSGSAANGGNSQGTGVRSPKTGEYDIGIEGADAVTIQQKGNGLHLMWLFLAGMAVISVTGAAVFLIYRKADSDMPDKRNR